MSGITDTYAPKDATDAYRHGRRIGAECAVLWPGPGGKEDARQRAAARKMKLPSERHLRAYWLGVARGYGEQESLALRAWRRV